MSEGKSGGDGELGYGNGLFARTYAELRVYCSVPRDEVTRLLAMEPTRNGVHEEFASAASEGETMLRWTLSSEGRAFRRWYASRT